VLLVGAGTLLLAQKKITDDEIYDLVRRRLASDPDVKGGTLEVEVKDGFVTLKGQLETEKARQKAERVTKKIKGVKGVDNKTTLKHK
jgi:hyperosmotically inducible protein